MIKSVKVAFWQWRMKRRLRKMLHGVDLRQMDTQTHLASGGHVYDNVPGLGVVCRICGKPRAEERL